jgi:hypothetical protein
MDVRFSSATHFNSPLTHSTYEHTHTHTHTLIHTHVDSIENAYAELQFFFPELFPPTTHTDLPV